VTDSLDQRLENKLDSLKNLNLQRSLPPVSTPQQRTITVNGESYINFSSNDYLGLATASDVTQMAASVLEQYGLGSGGSRLICGEHPLFERLETLLAEWKGTEAALSFGSGYLTSLGVIRSVMNSRDAIFYDELSHRCLLEGIQLSGSESFEFDHNNPDDLKRLLDEHRTDYDGALIVTEGLFSMDGDRAPIERLGKVSENHDAWFLVDEAHSAGVWGPDGAGLTVGKGDNVEIAMGTLSKAVGGYGGYVAGSQVLRRFLINRATTLIYSTGLPASVVAGSLSSLKTIVSQRSLRNDLKENVNRISEAFDERNIPLPDPASQIIPLLTGGTESTLQAGRRLKNLGLYAVPIRHPTVPRNLGRVRFSIRADHTEEDMQRLVDAVEELDQTGLLKRDNIWSC
jgi:8-amino-7-oxononanoate synthase